MRLIRLTAMTVVLALLTSQSASRAADKPAGNWVRLDAPGAGERAGAVLVPIPSIGRMLLLGGESKGGAPYVQGFDSAGGTWSELASAKPKPDIHPYYQTAYDPKTNKVYCLSAGPMAVFDLSAKTWETLPEDPALAGLSWHAVAIDGDSRRLVVVGADKKAGNIGWTRTVILDLDSGKWSTLPPPEERIVAEHKALVEAREALIDITGRTRLTWYRDPKGAGDQAELKDVSDRLGAVKKMPALTALSAEIDKVAELIGSRKTLDALAALEALGRKVDLSADSQYPVPASRRNSPLVFDAKNKVFVLFGGDHEDYLTNDTWILDLGKQAWRRGRPPGAPSPRAGHAMVYLPASARVALYEGYVQSSSDDYGAGASTPIQPVQLWLYDAKADRWDLAGAWQTRKGEPAGAPPPMGSFYGYSAQWFSPPALAADDKDRLILAGPGATWLLDADATKLSAADRLTHPPDERLYRTGRFLVSYCEVPEGPKEPIDLDNLPANQWVKLPAAPRNVAHGCRQRDWGTAAWDSLNSQFLMWGGGHCVRSASTVLHYSPVSGRMVEGYDADEPYGGNGGGGFGSSVLNRPWVPVHGYHVYAYDPKARLLVTATGFLYDPSRMDWLRVEPLQLPFRFVWSTTVLETTPHGVVAWAQQAGKEQFALWLFDLRKGWQDLPLEGKLHAPYCDSDGMTYDAKRDRLLIASSGGYARRGDGSLTCYDFKTRKVEKLQPENAEVARVSNGRELVYADHADWVLLGEPFVAGKDENSPRYQRIYDCARNKYFLMDTGAFPAGATYSQGWAYDAKRKMVHVLTYRGDAYALRLDPASAKLIERP